MGCQFQPIKRLILQSFNIFQIRAGARHLHDGSMSCESSPSGRTTRTPEPEMPRFASSHIRTLYSHTFLEHPAVGKFSYFCEADFGRIKILHKVQLSRHRHPQHIRGTLIRQIPLFWSPQACGPWIYPCLHNISCNTYLVVKP
jgi:hypothetical protein